MSTRKTIDPYLPYREHATNNEIEIVQSKECGCYFCRHHYDARKVNDWISDERGVSALCPECGMDAVVGDASGLDISKEKLKTLNLYFYGEDYMENHPEAATTYCLRFMDGKITHNEKNERFFLKYLTALAKTGSANAARTLANFYEIGGQFLPQDFQKSVYWYSRPFLKTDPISLVRLGYLYQRGYGVSEGENGSEKAFQCYAKSAALGNLQACYRLGDLYYYGVGAEKNRDLAFEIYDSCYGQSYDDFVFDRISLADLFETSCRIGRYYYEEKHDYFGSFRYFLISEFAFAYGLMENIFPKQLDLFPYVQEKVINLALKYNYMRREPIYDQDTFAASFIGHCDNVTSKYIEGCEFDQSSRTLTLTIRYTKPPLLIDEANLYCGFGPERIQWTFNDVAYFRHSSLEKEFVDQIWDGDDGWALFAAGSTEPIAEWKYVSRKVFTKPYKVKRIKYSKKKKEDK